VHDAGGFVVTRIKIEAATENAGVPQSDDDGATHAAERYFEHHVKLLLDADADLAPLAEIAEHHASHLSRNTLRRRDDGRQERFVTQRCFRVGRVSARRAMKGLLDALKSAGYTIIDAEEEFVVYDSDLSLDAGWIES
jgi:hypothetical protein